MSSLFSGSCVKVSKPLTKFTLFEYQCFQSRRDNLKGVLDNSGDLYDTLGYINEWLSTATDKVQALQDEQVDSQTEANLVKVNCCIRAALCSRIEI